MVLIGFILFLASVHSMNVYGVSINGIGGAVTGLAITAAGLYLAKR